MKNKEKQDRILENALSPMEEPDARLKFQIMQKAKEMERMKEGKGRKIWQAAAITAVVLLAGSGTTYAAWKYLTPKEVAERVSDSSLAKAFQEPGAVVVNESQEYGGYRITFLGVVSGENLSKYAEQDDREKIADDKTYIVTAIENADGSPRPETWEDTYGEEDFLVSPLIKGCNPKDINIFNMHGGYGAFVEDGVEYRLIECNNLECFADRGLYLSVNDGTFYCAAAFSYNEETGEITRSEDYEGVNALFDLPLDERKADPVAAEKYLRQMEETAD